MKLAGKKIEDVGERKYRTYTRVLFYIECVVSIFVLIAVIIFLPHQYVFFGILIALDIPIHNIISYYRTIMQITLNFRMYTLVGISYSLISILGFGSLWMGKLTTAKVYAGAYVFCEVIELIVCLFSKMGITLGEKYKLSEIKQDCIDLFKTGFPVLIAGLVVTFILNIDRQVVSLWFTLEDYAYYSFAYSLMNIIIVMVSALSIVLYPSLKSKSRLIIISEYNTLTLGLTMLVFGMFGFLPILDIFIKWYLPQYIYSLTILKCIFPAIAYICLIQIVLSNYFKIIEKTTQYLLVSIIALILSLGLDLLSALIFKSLMAIAIATVISCFVWAMMYHIILKKELKAINNFYLVYSFIMLVIYYFTVGVEYIVGKTQIWLVYIVLYAIITFGVLLLEKLALRNKPH